MRVSKFTIIASRRPESSNLNEELQWLGGSLGLFSLRDKDKSCFRIFIILLKEVRKKEGLSSDQIAQETGLTRGTVVHHLNKLMRARLVSHDENQYVLMVRNLEALINSVQHDVEQTLTELREVARKIDEQLK
ncbi:MAG: ArsR family transcriptional regulator [Nanoarchaeota archaeon]